MPFIHGFGQRRDVDPFTFHVKFRQWYGSRIGTHRAGDDSERKARAKRNAWDLIFPIFETKNFLANCPWRAHRFARQKRHTNRNTCFSRIYHGFDSIFFFVFRASRCWPSPAITKTPLKHITLCMYVSGDMIMIDCVYCRDIHDMTDGELSTKRDVFALFSVLSSCASANWFDRRLPKYLDAKR